MKKGKVWQITWLGYQLSTNAWYSSKHWGVRLKHKKDWNRMFQDLLERQAPNLLEEKITQYQIELQYWSTLDPTNVTAMIKIFEDLLRGLGVLAEDGPKYCLGLSIIPCEELRAEEYVLTIKKLA